ncbi:MAG TPA: nucleotide disphospho-sugar-binding domain-containing protein [Usitatibacter sp.]|nr:nucleotide disphospho-sugar-binding domain-containing protein [Usitatibacter sp.]
MARIAFAWEMGGELGHAMACNALAQLLRARGHHIAFMFRELHGLSHLSRIAAQDFFQAPVSVSEGQGATSVPSSFADILVGCGYDRPQHLAGLLAAWFALFERWKPDLVVADFSPTALLAARVMGLRRVSYSNGFSIPPKVSPLPAFRFDRPVTRDALVEVDSRALASVNGALALFGVPPLASLVQQFETDEDFLTTFPELDSYARRPQSGYWGPRVSFDSGEEVKWPEGEGKCVAVYLRQDSAHVDALIDALAASPHRVAAFIPDLSPERAAKLRSPKRVVATRPMKLGPLLAACDLLVSHGGNICPGTLMYGVAQLVFPTQYEQFLTAQRIGQIGAGAWLSPESSAEAVAQALARLLDDPSCKRAAAAFAARYPAYSPAEQQRRMVGRIEQILAQPARPSALPPADPALYSRPLQQDREPRNEPR